MEVPMEGSSQTVYSLKSFGFKVPLIFVSLLLLIVLWVSPPSFLSYSQLSVSEIQTIFSTQVTGNVKNNLYPLSVPSNSSAQAYPVRPDNPKQPVPQGPAPINTPESIPSDRPNSTVDPSLHETNGNPPLVDDGDTQLDPSTISKPPVQKMVDEKYIMPALSFQVGTGNQLIEYKSAIVIARTLNRTLCLSPFFIGPGRHFGYLGDRHSGLTMEERYSMEALSKFVKVASMPECLKACSGKLDVHWRLRKVSKAPEWNVWFNDTPRMSMDFDRNAPGWSTTKDVADFLGPRNDPKCVGLGGLFPGLRWKGVFFAASAYLDHSQAVMGAADHLVARTLQGGIDGPFVSVHWRFEESNCRGHPLGQCFSRCADGAVIANGRKSETWETMAREGKKQNTANGFHGVYVQKEDISGAIYDKAVEFGSRNVYLATDGWIRGKDSADTVKWVVEDLRNKSVNVAGLWYIWGLPNFADGSYVDPKNIAQVFGMDPRQKVSNHMIAMVEQEVCGRSTVFVGSGQSSWSLAVADTRQGRECQRKLSKQKREENPSMSDTELQNEVIDQILSIQYTPWPTCRGSKNNTNVPSEIEAHDGWLDYEACESRLLKNVGNCKRIQT